MRFPRPDGVSMTNGLIVLGYEDQDERDLAFDWLEAFGDGSSRLNDALQSIRAALDYAERHSHPSQRGDDDLVGMDISIGDLRVLSGIGGFEEPT